MRARHVGLLAALSITAIPARAAADNDVLAEIQSRFKAANKWFGMVADLPWDRAADGTLTPKTDALASRFVIRRDAAAQSIDVQLPPDAARPFRIEVHDSDVRGFWVRTIERSVAPSKAEVLRGMVIYRGAVAGGDLLYKVTPTHVDEYLYFRNPPAKLSRTFELDVGPGVLQAREAGDNVEIVGKDGTARLRVSAPLARAADGTRRRGTIRVSGRMLLEDIDLTGLTAPILVDPDWTTTGSMTVPHWGDVAWRRPDGRVMAVGGCTLAACPSTFVGDACSSQVIGSSDVWDPKSGTWTAGATLGTARYAHASASLVGGDFLVVGGCTVPGCALATALAERYVSATGSWIPAGSLDVARANAMAGEVTGGDILVVGGCTPNGCTASAQRYTPAANGWSQAASLPGPRGYAAAATLADGRVLVTGGCSAPDCSALLDDAVVYDPMANAWTAAGKMSSARGGHTATLLVDGAVLVTGGCSDATCNATLDSVDLWAPGSGFAPAPKMSGGRRSHTATRLPGGQVLVAGGSNGSGSKAVTVASVEVYYPAAKLWIKPNAMLMDRAFHLAVGLTSGNVLVAGGCDQQTCIPWAEVFSPASLPIDGDGGISYDGGPPIVPPTNNTNTAPAPRSPHPPLHRTGVVTCGSHTQRDVPCPIPGFPHQDAEYQPNDKPFESVSADEVKDSVTGLLWQASDGGGTFTQDQALAHCADVETPKAAKGSWRLPNVVELLTLVDYGRVKPSVDPKLASTRSTNYWTASRVSSTQTLAWTVKFDDGEVVPLMDSTALPARCVSGQSKILGTTRKGGPLVERGSTVVDERTGLEWQRRDEGTKQRWSDALDYCTSLKLAGHDDWHVPNVAELESIIEYGGDPGPIRIDPVFQNTAADLYWTSTPALDEPLLTWSVAFNMGVVNDAALTGFANVRCVRHLTPSGCGCQASTADVIGNAPVVLAPIALVLLRLRRRTTRRA